MLQRGSQLPSFVLAVAVALFIDLVACAGVKADIDRALHEDLEARKADFRKKAEEAAQVQHRLAPGSLPELPKWSRLCKETGNLYQLVETKKKGIVFTADVADSLASRMNYNNVQGHLATIHSDAELLCVRLAAFFSHSVYVGAKQSPSGLWMWRTDEAFCFDNWAPVPLVPEGEDNGPVSEVQAARDLLGHQESPKCSVLQGNSGLWDQVDCAKDAATTYFVVEYDLQGPTDGECPPNWNLNNNEAAHGAGPFTSVATHHMPVVPLEQPEDQINDRSNTLADPDNSLSLSTGQLGPRKAKHERALAPTEDLAMTRQRLQNTESAGPVHDIHMAETNAQVDDEKSLFYCPATGNFYLVVTVANSSGVSFEYSSDMAIGLSYEGEQGHLVTITSYAEQLCVERALHRKGVAFLGFSPLTSSSTSTMDKTTLLPSQRASFAWETKEPVCFENWDISDASAYPCAIIVGSTGKWQTAPCTSYFLFDTYIVEFPKRGNTLKCTS